MLTVGVRAHDYIKDSPELLFSRISNDGYKAVMLAFQKAILGIESYYDVTDQVIKNVKQAIEKNNLNINTLGVYMELGMVDENKRQSAVDEFLQGIKVAKKMNVANVATETTPFHKQPDVTSSQALKSLYRSIEQILPTAEQLNIKICVEPVYYHTLSSPELAKQLISDFNSKYLQITFDAVNLFEPKYKNNQKDLWDKCFDLFGDNIQVVHMKGITIEDEKLKKCGFSQSIIDYEYIFKQLKSLNRDLHIIREEADNKNGKFERAFLEELCKL